MDTKIIFFLLVFYFEGVLLLNSCEKLTTCHECLRDPSGCVWCPSTVYNNVRCYLESSNQTCPDPVMNPGNFAATSGDRDFSSDAGTVTQIKPQRYNMELRIGIPHNFSFSYKGAKDYPIDIYFLFDASKTMGRARNNTAKESKNMYLTMRDMTNNVYLGMGTFVDKNTLPFTLDVTKNKSYSFRHRLNMTHDYNKFQEAVDATPVGENFDTPEGGLDALAQVLACKEIIGWRNESRKIVVFLTDAPYHAAGDGRSGGIFTPYDGKCYTENGAYTEELKMDYPSVSMINKLARDNEVYIIFAVNDKLDSVYLDLANAISRSKKVILNNTDNDSLVKNLKDIYEDITKQIKLNVNVRRPFDRKNIDVSFDPNCKVDKNSACDVVIGKEHNFTGTITIKEYDQNDNASVEISIEGINEKLILDIKVIKDCECEQLKETNSSNCHGETLECGICICSEKRYGDKCACARIDDDAKNMNNDNSSCKRDKASDIICNNAGTCFCGECQCNDGFKGPYCECNVNNCTRDDSGLLCGGHGECQCDGKCKCDDGWSGSACSCDQAAAVCKGSNDRICNNRGNCDCTSCNCHAIADWDSRKEQDKYCVIAPCPDCHDLQCTTLTDCALCLVKEQNCSCSFTAYEIVKNLPKDLGNHTEWNVCSNVWVDVGCYTDFAYKYDEEQYRIVLLLQKKNNCNESYYIFGGIFLASLLLVGIFTLVAWKLLTVARDRQEFKRFVEDHNESISGPCRNPHYRPATLTFNNPTFGQSSVKYR